jgi:cellulose synthase (UDP-forming)
LAAIEPPPRADKDILNGVVRPSVEIALTCCGVLVTVVASVLLGVDIFDIVRASHRRPGVVLEQVVFGLVVGGLIYGNLAYHLTRIGFMRRLGRHRATSGATLSGSFDTVAPRVTILVPSYKEEARVIRQSLLSAALQRYPGKRVVLLIDDPPCPRSLKDRETLEAARALPGEIQGLLDACADRIASATMAMRRRTVLQLDLDGERRELARVHAEVASWFAVQAKEHPKADHIDELFVSVTYDQPCAYHLRRAVAIEADKSLGLREIERAYRGLEAIFRVEIAFFERKRFVNLSHEPNKAMNLNSYIGMIGGAYAWRTVRDSVRLEKTWPETAHLIVPDADYLITLDADSILYPDYAQRLVKVMEEPKNQRVAVIQTPYSAVPGAPGMLERIAGATTDIQYNIHQGFADHEGTYWVGANALLRMRALVDICVSERVNGCDIKRFISDRTVIEDTESSVDLLLKGWQLYNFPERLSFSATPADFGALLVQRRRWSNGGLIILPKLLRHIFDGRKPLAKAREGFFRIHYLISPTVVNCGVPILLLHPFEQNLRSPWLPLMGLPYFFFYGRDMMQLGYRPMDLLRVYSLNLMLIPVNLSGIFQSIRQILTGRHMAFERTPKTNGGTVAPRKYVLTIYVITMFAFLSAVFDLFGGLRVKPLFAIMNGMFFLYAIVRFLPKREAGSRERGTGVSHPRPWKRSHANPVAQSESMGLIR